APHGRSTGKAAWCRVRRGRPSGLRLLLRRLDLSLLRPLWNPGLGCRLRPLDGPLGGKFRDSRRSWGGPLGAGYRRNRRVFETIHHPSLSLGPSPVHPARAEQEAVRMLAHAHVERDRSLHGFDDVPEGHLVGRPTEDVATMGPPTRPDEPLVYQL